MKKKFDFTYEEIINSLKSISSDVNTGFTKTDLIMAMGWSESWAGSQLRRLLALGRVEHIGFRSGVRVDGRSCKKPVYQIIKTK